MNPQPLQESDVLFRDDDLMVVNKPAGIPVHGSRILEGRPATLYAMAREYSGRMVHAVHRLDRPVSGAMVLAFNKETLTQLGRMFEHRLVKKRYLAVVRGWPPEQGRIDHALLPPRDGRVATALPQPAQTRFERIATVEIPVSVPPYPASRYSLLALYPETGRRHQLRRHMKHISHHLAGDTTYGRGEHNRVFREQYACSRLLLHSESLAFSHPRSGESLSITAAPDESFSGILEAFGWTECAGLHNGGRNQDSLECVSVRRHS